jgi:hypothetical protein
MTKEFAEIQEYRNDDHGKSAGGLQDVDHSAQRVMKRRPQRNTTRRFFNSLFLFFAKICAACGAAKAT